MPGKILYLSLRRSCIKPWRIKLLVTVKDHLCSHTIENENAEQKRG
jgi:hypothetical protein